MAGDDSIPDVFSGPRRSTQLRQAPRHLDPYIAVFSAVITELLPDDGDNLQFHDICDDAYWIVAMGNEYAFILQNDTWELLPLPPGKWSNSRMIEALATSLMEDFAMTDLGLITKYLGVNFVLHPHGLLLHQESYTLSILEEFSFLDCRPSFIPLNEGVQLRREIGTSPVDSTLYKRLVGKLLYLIRTRPDIAFATNQASRYMHEAQELHLAVVKGILRYLKRYPSYGIFYDNGEDDNLEGYSDANYAADLDEPISTSAYLFTLGSSSWNSKKHSSTARSSCESEYCGLTLCAMEAMWIRRLLQEIGCYSANPTRIGVDNHSAIKLANNPVFHDRTKHFKVDWHFCRQSKALEYMGVLDVYSTAIIQMDLEKVR
ncbi:hypothetical protein AXG93_3050s1000 [Marchantia polymorpha subsp. ruderalis]|uniref:Reverse transcriptase Ty1/copia-type domain-containing protein n=1 Tax=Marchantia polymorpha subsp. ruderalis TaxID=1480154 RepID=A0A176WE92_MARPO|nr:hypothetical protein AXG93_3050s1000 [Marchantia polymorpha subsp. ruderalis]